MTNWGKIAFAGLMAIAATPAAAQLVPEEKGAADRQRPEYAPVGIRYGSFFLYPNVYTAAEYNDNVLAAETDKRDALIFQIKPNLRVKSNWGRNSIDLYGYALQSVVTSLSSESRLEYGGSFQGQLDTTRNSLFYLRLIGDHLTQRRTDIDNNRSARNPVEYDRIGADLGYRLRLARLRVDTEVGVERRDYQDAVAFDGTTINQDFRDVTRLDGSVRVSYPVSPGIGVVAAASVNKRTYDVQPGDPEFDPLTSHDRDSSGMRIEGGLDFEITSLLYGDVRVGYLDQNFQDPALKDVNGLSLTTSLLWNVTPLTSFRLDAERRVDDTASPTVAGRVRTQASLGVDHELLRNLILTGEANYSHLDYVGIARTADLYGASFRARYLMSRLTTITAGIEHLTRTATLATDRYKINRIWIGVSLTR